MTEQFRYDGRVAIVTGAGAGLGRSHALAFAARGARVVVNDLGGSAHGDGKSSSAADAVVAEIKAAGGEAVASYDSVEDGARIVQTALDAFGTVDIVINNAGILRDVSFQKMTEQDWDLIYRVHLLGSMRVTQAAWPILREKQYGRIVMTSSAAGLYGNFGQANYAAAKLALVGFAQTLAEEGRSKNIHVNTIAPAAASRLLSTVLPQDVMALLKPEYVSPLVAWLCHERCEETKGVFEVGAGYIGKLRWERSEGAFLGGRQGVSVEEIAAKWDKITDFGSSTHPSSPTESFTSILERASKPRLGGNAFIDLDEASGDSIEAESAYDERDLSLYALGVGAARDALDPKELPYVYELGDGFQALPTYAVMPALNTFLNLARDGRGLKGLNYGLDRVLHGEQYTELLRPLPLHARLRHVFRFKTAYDKDPHALVVLAVDTLDESGEKLAYNEITVFVRGAGGWGGERGPAGEADAPPARAPDAVIEERTDPNQALLYRLSGDWNPMHADPAFAQAFGFDKPILHGLCTFGFVGRHVIKAFAGNDGRRFKSIKVRFAKSVFPGETLVTRMWKESDRRIVFETRVKERDEVAISHAAVEFHAEIPQARPRADALPAPAQPAAPQAGAGQARLTAADAFEVIAAHVAAHPELAAQVQTVFQFKVRNPESDWVLDLKNGGGECRPGSIDKPDCTLELDEEHIEIVVTKPLADVQKLYFANKLKIGGNLMASQKLAALQAIGAEPYAQAKARRMGTAAPAPPEATAVTAPAAAPPAPTTADIFKVIEKHLALHKGLGEQIKTLFQFKLKDPDADWVVDLKAGDGAVRAGVADKPDATLELSDADFLAMSTGQADPTKLYFGGRMKIGGNIMASQKLSFLQKIDPRLLEDVLKARTGAAPAVATPASSPPAAAPSGPTSADLFETIRRHLAQHRGLGDQTRTLFQFKLRDPASNWVLDLKAGDGEVRGGSADKPDVTLELSDADFVAMSTGQADAQKLYFGGKLKLVGNIMASQKLMFLQKIDPKLLQAVLAERAAAAPPATPAASAKATMAPAAASGRAKAIFAALDERLASDARAAGALAGEVVQFHLREPASDWVLDLSGAKPRVEAARAPEATATFTLDDADLGALADGKAQARDLYQRGRLRVDGAARLAHELDRLAGLLRAAGAAVAETA
ncbi:peroxisomal multifunctional enzyme type 2 [Luteimonas aquatica]|uniref:peroxisomal multifunctional enzyme type 2 n=1 Tax=Luteimonas aquatica TaxID=450364 RepID=UPI001F57E54D|nr:peroxisomal multifunctional enzyme type 2 [Luteimonas aquatica]